MIGLEELAIKFCREPLPPFPNEAVTYCIEMLLNSNARQAQIHVVDVIISVIETDRRGIFNPHL